MPRGGKPKKGLKVESLQLLTRTEGLAETSPTKRGLEVRGGVLSLPKMTTGLSISGLPAGAVNICNSRGLRGILGARGKASAEAMQDNPRLLRHFEIFGRHRAASKEQQGR
jgi:hypothetical protein